MTIDHLEFSRKPYDDYIEQLNRECASHTALPEISYRYETERKTQTVAQRIFSCLYYIASLPYQLIHWIAGLYISPLTLRSLSGFTVQRTVVHQESDKQSMIDFYQFSCLDKSVPQNIEPWKYKRISVEVDGNLVDAMLVVRDSTAKNGKWILRSNAQRDFYEIHKTHTTFPKKLALSLDSNVLLFNYPGIGASQGSFTQEAIAKTYQVMLRFLEDNKKGIGASTIIGAGHCLGANVQGEALKDHELQPNINYIFVKDRCASKFSKVTSGLNMSWIEKLLELCGWNMDTLSSSKQLLNAHEILLHTAKDTTKRTVIEITDPNLIINDGLIAKEDTLAYHILRNQDSSFSEKLKKTTVLGISEHHHYPLSLSTLYELSKKIKNISEKNTCQH